MARTIIFRSLIVGPSNSLLVALSDTKALDRGIPLQVLSYLHTISLNTLSPGEPDNTEQNDVIEACPLSAPLASSLYVIPRMQVYNIVDARGHLSARRYAQDALKRYDLWFNWSTCAFQFQYS